MGKSQTTTVRMFSGDVEVGLESFENPDLAVACGRGFLAATAAFGLEGTFVLTAGDESLFRPVDLGPDLELPAAWRVAS